MKFIMNITHSRIICESGSFICNLIYSFMRCNSFVASSLVSNHFTVYLCDKVIFFLSYPSLHKIRRMNNSNVKNCFDSNFRWHYFDVELTLHVAGTFVNVISSFEIFPSFDKTSFEVLSTEISSSQLAWSRFSTRSWSVTKSSLLELLKPAQN